MGSSVWRVAPAYFLGGGGTAASEVVVADGLKGRTTEQLLDPLLTLLAGFLVVVLLRHVACRQLRNVKYHELAREVHRRN